MNDFNFFAVYERRTALNKSPFLIVLSLVLFLITSAYIAAIEVNVYFNKRKLNEQIIVYEEILNSGTYAAMDKIVNELTQTLTAYTTYKSVLEEINTGLLEAEKIDSSYITKITEIMPKELYVSSFSVNAATITLRCTTTDRVKAAELQYNLKSLDFIDDVFIGSLVKSAGFDRYDFSITCNVRGVVKVEGTNQR